MRFLHEVGLVNEQIETGKAERQPLSIALGAVQLNGELMLPRNPAGLVIFAHGSGSSRHSPRNQFVAHALQEAGLATLLFDLLTSEEESSDSRTGHLRFDIQFLADRLQKVADAMAVRENTSDLKIGFFGASTGASAALMAAANPSDRIAAVVSRGGRPDLAGTALAFVRVPTLLIVGGDDDVVIQLNREAFHNLQCEKELKIVPDATHLFEEPGTLEEVARMAAEWFRKHFLKRRLP